jgi:hypothetical protein
LALTLISSGLIWSILIFRIASPNVRQLEPNYARYAKHL